MEGIIVDGKLLIKTFVLICSNDLNGIVGFVSYVNICCKFNLLFSSIYHSTHYNYLFKLEYYWFIGSRRVSNPRVESRDPLMGQCKANSALFFESWGRNIRFVKAAVIRRAGHSYNNLINGFYIFNGNMNVSKWQRTETQFN